MKHTITLIPGDGIGPEIVAATADSNSHPPTSPAAASWPTSQSRFHHPNRQLARIKFFPRQTSRGMKWQSVVSDNLRSRQLPCLHLPSAWKIGV